MNVNRHIIKKQVLEFKAPDHQRARELQELVTDIYKTKVTPMLNRICDRYDLGNSNIRIESLELDLGRLSEETLLEELPQKIELLFTEELNKRVYYMKNDLFASPFSDTIIDKKETLTHSFRHFLKTGSFPWHGNPDRKKVKTIFNELTHDNPSELKKVLTADLTEAIVRKRLVYQLDEMELETIVKLVAQKSEKQILNLRRELQLVQQKEHFFAGSMHSFIELLWEVILRNLVKKNSTVQPEKLILQELIEKLSYSDAEKQDSKNSLGSKLVKALSKLRKTGLVLNSNSLLELVQTNQTLLNPQQAASQPESEQLNSENDNRKSFDSSEIDHPNQDELLSDKKEIEQKEEKFDWRNKDSYQEEPNLLKGNSQIKKTTIFEDKNSERKELEFRNEEPKEQSNLNESIEVTPQKNTDPNTKVSDANAQISKLEKGILNLNQSKTNEDLKPEFEPVSSDLAEDSFSVQENEIPKKATDQTSDEEKSVVQSSKKQEALQTDKKKTNQKDKELVENHSSSKDLKRADSQRENVEEGIKIHLDDNKEVLAKVDGIEKPNDSERAVIDEKKTNRKDKEVVENRSSSKGLKPINAQGKNVKEHPNDNKEVLSENDDDKKSHDSIGVVNKEIEEQDSKIMTEHNGPDLSEDIVANQNNPKKLDKESEEKINALGEDHLEREISDDQIQTNEALARQKALRIKRTQSRNGLAEQQNPAPSMDDKGNVSDIPWKPITKPLEEAYINNAGLVLIWPFLPTLFKGLNWMEDNEFKSEEEQYKALWFLQFLVTGSTDSDENDLVLNKLLVGLRAETPIPSGIELSKEEKEEAEHLLKVVIEKWAVLKGTSAEGFRATFLRKEGLLKRDFNGWKLYVERSTMDVLLEKLPWSYSVIKLSWITEMIFVEW